MDTVVHSEIHSLSYISSNAVAVDFIKLDNVEFWF